MSINKIIHFYKKYETLPEICNKYNVNINDVIYENNLDKIKLREYYPIIINLPHKCTYNEQINCLYEKRGCNGCYYNTK